MSVLQWTIIVAAAGAAWFVCAHVAFSRTTLRTVMKFGDESDSSRHDIWTWKYPGWRAWALVGLVIIPVLTVAGLLLLPSGKGGGRVAAGARPEPLPASETHTPVPATATLAPRTPTGLPSQTPVEVVPTQVTPTQTPSLTPTEVQPTETIPVASPSPSPTEIAPTWTPTLPPTETSTWTPTPSPTPLPPTWTLTPLPTTAMPVWTLTPTAPPLELLAPLLGREYKNPVTLEWSGVLHANQTYRVGIYHLISGYSLQSNGLAIQTWTVRLPPEKFGEWRWQVSVIRNDRIVATSPEWMFWFNPFPGTRYPTPTPTPTPTRTPRPPASS